TAPAGRGTATAMGGATSLSAPPGAPPVTGAPLTARLLADRLVAASPEAPSVARELGSLRSTAGLLRYNGEQRQLLGITNSALQLKKSLAALQLLRRRSMLLPFLKETTIERLGGLVALRVGLCEARRLLRPTILGAERGQ